MKNKTIEAQAKKKMRELLKLLNINPETTDAVLTIKDYVLTIETVSKESLSL